MTKKEEFELVEVFAGTSLQAEMVKSLLLDVNIEAFIKDGHMGTMFPFHTAPGAAGSVKIVVSNQNYDQAKLIVEDYYRNLNS
ncbi:MAG: hypothetical protein C0597_08550 [Marinilabiliales bacterium]|nr:MAG: hypothetical protein C0597_08550 [Marinilabiliales bacterium]